MFEMRFDVSVRINTDAPRVGSAEDFLLRLDATELGDPSESTESSGVKTVSVFGVRSEAAQTFCPASFDNVGRVGRTMQSGGKA